MHNTNKSNTEYGRARWQQQPSNSYERRMERVACICKGMHVSWVTRWYITHPYRSITPPLVHHTPRECKSLGFLLKDDYDRVDFLFLWMYPTRRPPGYHNTQIFNLLSSHPPWGSAQSRYLFLFFNSNSHIHAHTRTAHTSLQNTLSPKHIHMPIPRTPSRKCAFIQSINTKPLLSVFEAVCVHNTSIARCRPALSIRPSYYHLSPPHTHS